MLNDLQNLKRCFIFSKLKHCCYIKKYFYLLRPTWNKAKTIFNSLNWQVFWHCFEQCFDIPKSFFMSRITPNYVSRVSVMRTSEFCMKHATLDGFCTEMINSTNGPEHLSSSVDVLSLYHLAISSWTAIALLQDMLTIIAVPIAFTIILLFH